MIDFRYHVVSIIAVFLALALGLFLGSTTLQGTVATSLSHQAANVRDENRSLESQLSTSQSQLGDQQRFSAALEPAAVADRLSGETVAVVSAPGVSSTTRSDLETTLADAGASIGSDVSLSSAYLDPTQASELGALAQELAGSRTLSGGNGAVKADTVLADALLDHEARTGPGSHLSTALSAFSDGKLLSVADSSGVRPADVAVLLVPAPSGSASAQTLSTQASELLELAHALGSVATSTVLAGPSPTSVSGSVVDAATSGASSGLVARVSVVSATDTSAGRIACVFALAAGLTGQVGVYGPGESTPLPTASASPTP